MILQFENKVRAAASRPGAPCDAATALTRLGKELQRLGYRFVTPTPSTIKLVNARPGNERARRLVDIFGWNREFHPDLVPAAVFDAMRDAGVLQEADKGFRSSVSVASIGDQLYFHTPGHVDAHDAVTFGPDAYRFARQLRACVPALSDRVTRCVDLRCGAGAGAIELARMCPTASVHAVDSSPAALNMTRVNALLANAPSVLPEYSDLLANVPGTFDLIVANVPYLLPEQARSEPDGGGGPAGAMSLATVNAAIGRLAPGGTLLLYTGAPVADGVDRLGDELARRLERAALAWSYEEIDPDVRGEELADPAHACADRIAAVWLRVTKPASHKVYW